MISKDVIEPSLTPPKKRARDESVIAFEPSPKRAKISKLHINSIKLVNVTPGSLSVWWKDSITQNVVEKKFSITETVTFADLAMQLIGANHHSYEFIQGEEVVAMSSTVWNANLIDRKVQIIKKQAFNL